MSNLKKILVPVESILDAFLFEEDSSNVLFAQEKDLEDYLTNPEKFEAKVFGDGNTGMFVDFVYRENDPDFSPENLEEVVKRAVWLKLLGSSRRLKDK